MRTINSLERGNLMENNIRTYHFNGTEANMMVDIEASTLSEARRRFRQLFGSWPNPTDMTMLDKED